MKYLYWTFLKEQRKAAYMRCFKKFKRKKKQFDFLGCDRQKPPPTDPSQPFHFYQNKWRSKSNIS